MRFDLVRFQDGLSLVYYSYYLKSIVESGHNLGIFRAVFSSALNASPRLEGSFFHFDVDILTDITRRFFLIF
jgi:hypothetical protein